MGKCGAAVNEVRVRLEDVRRAWAARDPEVVRLSGSDRHPILRRAAANCAVEGTALALTPAEIEAADRYEVADYVRIAVTLASGRQAFVYVHRDEAEGR